MKKIIATLLVAILALSTVSTYALEVTDSATAIKKAAIAAIKAGDMTEIIDLLNKISSLSAKQQAVILNAIKAALNTATLKKEAPAAVEALNGAGCVSVTKAAGGKWNIQIVTTDSNIKADIPRGAVEKPTLSTSPASNNR
ncbi:MAG: hypothetical protein IKP58_12960 [Victivallales bacterium]|nr:hypothetical protein [Victivallales bacterium]